MAQNSGMFVLFALLALASGGVSVYGWLHGDGWGALATVMAWTFALISLAVRFHGDPKNRLNPVA